MPRAALPTDGTSKSVIEVSTPATRSSMAASAVSESPAKDTALATAGIRASWTTGSSTAVGKREPVGAIASVVTRPLPTRAVTVPRASSREAPSRGVRSRAMQGTDAASTILRSFCVVAVGEAGVMCRSDCRRSGSSTSQSVAGTATRVPPPRTQVSSASKAPGSTLESFSPHRITIWYDV